MPAIIKINIAGNKTLIGSNENQQNKFTNCCIRLTIGSQYLLQKEREGDNPKKDGYWSSEGKYLFILSVDKRHNAPSGCHQAEKAASKRVKKQEHVANRRRISNSTSCKHKKGHPADDSAANWKQCCFWQRLWKNQRSHIFYVHRSKLSDPAHMKRELQPVSNGWVRCSA